MTNFRLAHEYEEYRDFEPIHGIQYAGYARITLNVEKHTAYGVLVNPQATPTNDVPTLSEETKDLTWAEATDLIGGSPPDYKDTPAAR